MGTVFRQPRQRERHNMRAVVILSMMIVANFSTAVAAPSSPSPIKIDDDGAPSISKVELHFHLNGTTKDSGDDYGDDYINSINPNGEDYDYSVIGPLGGGGCFPESSQVQLTTGESHPMADLKTGDSIITIVDGKLTPTKVLGFMFKKYGSGAYLTIHTEDGNKVTKSRVLHIEAGEKEGAYVPLTEHGTLLVDGVLCSSFANVPHGIAQLLAAPLRWFPSVLLSEEEGERFFVTAAKHAGYYLHKLGLLNFYHSKALQKDGETEFGSLEYMEGPPTVSSKNVDTCPIKH